MHLLEDATRLVSLAGLFSSNENVEEVPTSNIKYFLLPALLGTLSLKLCVADRLEVITTAEVYFRDFLQRVKDYGVADVDIPTPVEIPDEESATDMVNAMHTNRGMDIAAMARQRHAKIERQVTHIILLLLNQVLIALLEKRPSPIVGLDNREN